MRYLYSTNTGKIYTCDDSEINDLLERHPEDTEVTERNAYMLLFFRISQVMGKKFSNYRNADIQSEVLMMMIKRYQERGVYAPDKPFKDNERIWWSFAKKSCYFLIRQFKRHISKSESIDNLENMDNMCYNPLAYEEALDFEGSSLCAEMQEYFQQLTHSKVYSEMQLGVYAVSNLGGLTDNDIMDILGVQVPMNTIPITPGRNLAVILEVAAMNNRQRKMGYNPALEFTEQINRHFEETMRNS